MVVEGGWDQDLASPECALRQPQARCLYVKPHPLPQEHRCNIHGDRYKYFQLGSWYASGQRRKGALMIGVHRTMCWLARGNPPAEPPKQECMHSCHRPQCCNPELGDTSGEPGLASSQPHAAQVSAFLPKPVLAAG